MSESSLVVVGTGIKFVSHITTEVKAYIEQSDLVIYLVNDPAMKEWIKKTNPQSESLDELYNKFPNRLDCYHAITDYILVNVRKKQNVCVVLYGHPSVFSMPGLDAVKKAKEEGYYAKLLPAISAEDCLFADLLIDPGSVGCQSYEATDFLVYHRQFDTSSHLILWQIDAVGILDHASTNENKIGINLLTDYLSKFYDKEHEITIYEAAQYPGFEPRIEKIALNKLAEIDLSRISTLYIPPSRKSSSDKAILDLLKIK